jgi:hypothetical protein
VSKKSQKGGLKVEVESGGGFARGGLVFALGAVTALVVQKFWRPIVKSTVSGAVRAQRRVKEISAEVMEDVEDVWAEESENGAAPPPADAPSHPSDG